MLHLLALFLVPLQNAKLIPLFAPIHSKPGACGLGSSIVTLPQEYQGWRNPYPRLVSLSYLKLKLIPPVYVF